MAPQRCSPAIRRGLPVAISHSHECKTNMLSANSRENMVTWSRLAWIEVISKYRKTILGPFWITLSTGVTIVFLGLLYGKILGFDIEKFLPYLAIGLILWGFVAAILQEAPLLFIANRNVILNMPIAVEYLVVKMIVKNIFVMLHNFVLVALLALFYPLQIGLSLLGAILGLLLGVAFSYFLTIVLAMLGARFRDVAQTITALLGMVFMATPIIWYPHMLGKYQFIVEFNPIYHFIEVVRAALIDNAFAISHLLTLAAMTLAAYLVATVALRRYRKTLVFWI